MIETRNGRRTQTGSGSGWGMSMETYRVTKKLSRHGVMICCPRFPRPFIDFHDGRVDGAARREHSAFLPIFGPDCYGRR